MVNILMVIAGGVLGAIVRYTFGFVAIAYFGRSTVMTGTVLSNMFGCFLGGFFISWAYLPLNTQNEILLMIMMGFIGAVTTFSTFSLECVKLMNRDTLPELTAYLFIQLVVALLFTLAGLWAGGLF